MIILDEENSVHPWNYKTSTCILLHTPCWISGDVQDRYTINYSSLPKYQPYPIYYCCGKRIPDNVLKKAKFLNCYEIP